MDGRQRKILELNWPKYPKIIPKTIFGPGNKCLKTSHLEFIYYTFFFISNTFFQLSLSVVKLLNELSFECCSSVAYYIWTLFKRDTLYFVYLCLCLRLGLFVSYLFELFFIFIFIKVNHKISLKKEPLLFGATLPNVQPEGFHGKTTDE